MFVCLGGVRETREKILVSSSFASREKPSRKEHKDEDEKRASERMRANTFTHQICKYAHIKIYSFLTERVYEGVVKCAREFYY